MLILSTTSCMPLPSTTPKTVKPYGRPSQSSSALTSVRLTNQPLVPEFGSTSQGSVGSPTGSPWSGIDSVPRTLLWLYSFATAGSSGTWRTRGPSGSCSTRNEPPWITKPGTLRCTIELA